MMFFQDKMEEALREELINKHSDLSLETKIDGCYVILNLNRSYETGVAEDAQIRMVYKEEKLILINFFVYNTMENRYRIKEFPMLVSLFDKFLCFAEALKKKFQEELEYVPLRIINPSGRGYIEAKDF